MRFEQLNDGPCKTYLVVSEGSGEAMLVDPVLEEVDRYLDVLVWRRLVLRYVVDTHVHADHISGGPAIRDRLGTDYVMHHDSISACANVRVGEGDVLRLGDDVEVQVLHTPGHTPGSISLRLPDRLLTGDFLFIGPGGAGRTDLLGGDAGEHWDSLRKLRSLPGELLVFPAHDYHGREHSSLGEERSFNPRMQERSREDYVQWLEEQHLGPAEWMADVIHANYACATNPRGAWIPADRPTCEVGGTRGSVNAQLVHTIGAETLMGALISRDPPVVLDVRERRELDEHGHIAGARHIPVGTLARHLSELDGLEGHPIVTVCRSGGRSSTAAAVLTTAGFTSVRSLDGGMARWIALGYPIQTGTEAA